MKIRPVEAELFHASRRTDGQTDMTKFLVAFRNFSPEKDAFRRQVAPAKFSFDVLSCSRHQGGRTTHVTPCAYHNNVPCSKFFCLTLENDKGITRGSHGGNHKDYCRLESDAVTFDTNEPTFRRKHAAEICLYLSSKLHGMVSQKTVVSGR